jgi:glutamate/tyrosine decarboxylase-like PLP-dependent enzyme
MAAGRGLQLSRGFKALKPWMSLKEHGLARFGRLVAQNVRQARYLAELLDRSEVLKRVAPVALNVVAFRCEDAALSPAAQDEANRELLMRIQERGVAVPSSTRLHGRLTLRVCICNHRSRRRDFDDFVHQAESLAREVLEETRRGAGAAAR